MTSTIALSALALCSMLSLTSALPYPAASTSYPNLSPSAFALPLASLLATLHSPRPLTSLYPSPFSLTNADYTVVEQELRLDRSYALTLSELNAISAIYRAELGDLAAFAWIRGQKYITFFSNGSSQADAPPFLYQSTDDGGAAAASGGVLSAAEARARGLPVVLSTRARMDYSSPYDDNYNVVDTEPVYTYGPNGFTPVPSAASALFGPLSTPAQQQHAEYASGSVSATVQDSTVPRRLYVLSALTPETTASLGALLLAVQDRSATVVAKVAARFGVSVVSDYINTAVFPATCQDRMRGENETDVDCGGVDCDQCFGGSRCRVTTDCNSLNCLQLPTDNPAVPALRCTVFLKPNAAARPAGAATLGWAALSAVAAAAVLVFFG